MAQWRLITGSRELTGGAATLNVWETFWVGGIWNETNDWLMNTTRGTKVGLRPTLTVMGRRRGWLLDYRDLRDHGTTVVVAESDVFPFL